MVAQLLGEMLRSQTFESFRVYSLDTVARLSEAIDLLRDIYRDRIPRQAFDPVRSELEWSLSKDPVVLRVASGEIAHL
jgi:hypothetical protein